MTEHDIDNDDTVIQNDVLGEIEKSEPIVNPAFLCLNPGNNFTPDWAQHCMQVTESIRNLNIKVNEVEKELMEHRISDVKEQYKIKEEFNAEQQKLVNIISAINLRSGIAFTFLSILTSVAITKLVSLIFSN